MSSSASGVMELSSGWVRGVHWFVEFSKFVISDSGEGVLGAVIL